MFFYRKQRTVLMLLQTIVLLNTATPNQMFRCVINYREYQCGLPNRSRLAGRSNSTGYKANETFELFHGNVSQELYRQALFSYPRLQLCDPISQMKRIPGNVETRSFNGDRQRDIRGRYRIGPNRVPLKELQLLTVSQKRPS